MKNLVLITVLFFAFFNVNAQYSREEAIEIVAYEIVGVYELETHHLYSKLDKMYLNDTLMLEILEYYLCPMDEAWLFFIDDMPIAYWSHPARIIWFDVNTGEIQILDE